MGTEDWTGLKQEELPILEVPSPYMVCRLVSVVSMRVCVCVWRLLECYLASIPCEACKYREGLIGQNVIGGGVTARARHVPRYIGTLVNWYEGKSHSRNGTHLPQYRAV